MSFDNPAIRVQHLSKCYEIYDLPQDRLKQSLYPRFQRLVGRQPKNYFRDFWALRDVCFEVEKGETVGIIGRNGSGKSTLLQIICGTLSPTSGTVETNGRVAALLELGSGFNPEFTGRENVHMNGAILGLSPKEVAARFNDIADFADIGGFIDQPMKTYSSGMSLRLAFAVAIHVEPTVLVIDEYLSVGDIRFQNKCLEQIHKLVEQGVSVLIVSHDISTVQLLCSRVIWLDGGVIKAGGKAVTVSQEYYLELMGHGTLDGGQFEKLPVQHETGKALFTDLRFVECNAPHFSPGQPLKIAFALLVKQDLGPVVFSVSIYRSDGDWVVGLTSRDADVVWEAAKAGDVRRGILEFDSLCLAPGDYLVAFGASSADYSLCYALTDLSLRFSVRATSPTWGKFLHPCRWVVEPS